MRAWGVHLQARGRRLLFVAMRVVSLLLPEPLRGRSCAHHQQAGEQLLHALAALWALPAEAVQQYAALHKPAVQAGATDLAVGRATLPLLDAAAGRAALAAAAGGGAGAGGARAPSRFAPTGHALRNMERVAAGVAQGEPVLLVGETGTGKTTLVQQIAKQVGGVGGGGGGGWATAQLARSRR